MTPQLLLELSHLFYVESRDKPKNSSERERLLQIAIDINRKARR